VRARQLYPVLLAAFPAIQLAGANPGQYDPHDLIEILAVLFTAVAALALLLRLVLPPNKGEVIPALLSALVVWSFLYMPVYRRIHEQSGLRTAHAITILVGAAITGVMLAWIDRKPHRAAIVDRFMTLLTLLITVPWTIKLLKDAIAIRNEVAQSALAGELGAPLSRRGPGAAGTSVRPDVYIILLDMYAGSKILRERYGFDNHAFEDSLRTLGFFIPKIVRSNYNQTTYSLPSLLNFAHMTGILRDVGRGPAEVPLAYHLLGHDRTSRFLRSLGYRMVFFPSSWWQGTADHSEADERFHAWAGTGLGSLLARSDLRRHLRAKTPLALLDLSKADLSHVNNTIGGLKRVPEIPGPTLALAHILLPHTPIITTADCRPVAGRLPPDSAEAAREYVRQYLGQVACTNQIILDLVTTLLRRSPTPPIILLQGDHGATAVEPFTEHWHSPAVQELRAQFETFGAYYLPGHGARALGPDVALVNLLRDLLRYYFGLESLPREPDTLHYLLRPTDEAVRLLRVPARLLARAGGDQAAHDSHYAASRIIAPMQRARSSQPLDRP
jgi:hypothetical protein